MTAEQLTFDLPIRAAEGREDFLVAPCNAAAIALIDKWPDWQNNFAIIHGPPAAGKTHILNVWAAKAQALILSSDIAHDILLEQISKGRLRSVAMDDMDDFLRQEGARGEEFLFHMINALREQNGFLLAGMQMNPASWDISLPDLASRLKAMHIIEIHLPDEALLMGLFVKLLSDRQLTVDPEVIPFIVNRYERSFENIYMAVEKIDAASLKEKRRITLPFVKKTLSL